MKKHAGFIREIIENPDDNDIRLIYADWLEDNGSPEYAEHLRVHARDFRIASPAVALAGCRFLGEYGVRLFADFAPRRKLPQSPRNRPRWLHGPEPVTDNRFTSDIQYIFRVVGKGGVQFRVRRGFAESVTCDTKYWSTYGRKIAANHPITTLEFNDLAYYRNYTSHSRCELFTDHLDTNPLTGHLRTALESGYETVAELNRETSVAALRWARKH